MPRTKKLSSPDAKQAVLAVVGAHPKLRPFSQSLPMSLLRAREAAMRRFRPSLRRFGLTEQQWRVLRALSISDSIEISDLASQTCLLGPSLSRILQDLEARVLITRNAHPDDARRGLVGLSKDGATLIERVTPFSESAYAQIAKRFGPEKLALLQSLLRDFETALDDTEPARSSERNSRTPSKGVRAKRA